LAGGRRFFETTLKANRRTPNKKYRMMKGGIALLCLFNKIDRSTKDSRQAEYLKSKIRIPKFKICFLKFLFRSDCSLAASGGTVAY